MMEAWIFFVAAIPPLFLHVPLHEIGHYIAARLFGYKAKIYWKPQGQYLMRCEYTSPEETPHHKMYLISFAGALGVFAFVPYFILSKDFVTMIFVITTLMGYSIYEVYHRFTSLTVKGENK